MKALKRKKTLTPLVMQDPCDMAKLGLLNSSFQRFVGWPSASTASSCRDIGIHLLCRWVGNLATDGLHILAVTMTDRPNNLFILSHLLISHAKKSDVDFGTIFEMACQFVSSSRFQPDQPSRKPNYVCQLTDDFETIHTIMKRQASTKVGRGLSVKKIVCVLTLFFRS